MKGPALYVMLLCVCGIVGACKEEVQSSKQEKKRKASVRKRRSEPQHPASSMEKKKVKSVRRGSIAPKIRTSIVRKAPPVRWYQPRYRERRFYPPRERLKRIPHIHSIPATVIQHGSRNSNQVALTFDACSWNNRPRFDRKVAEILIRTRTPATIFMGGLWALKRKKDAKWLASFPFFEIANHAYKHGHLKKVSKKRLVRELRWTQEALYTVLGVVPKLFRPPYIEYNQRVARVAGMFGMKTIIGLSSGDPDPTFTKNVLIRYMKKAIRPGSIVVMHINKGGKHTAKALPQIIKNVKRKGYQLVTVGTMLHGGKNKSK